jgi:molybdopterin synthase catalytic subunit
MRVRLLAFASAAEALAPETELELPDGATVGDLKRRLATDHPQLAALWTRLAVAVDGELVGDRAPLVDGAEVALLPPVSGGGPPATALVEEPLDVSAAAALVAGADCGAVVIFVGTVRDHHQGRAVARLTYSAYRPLAERRLAAIAGELERRHGARLALRHRLGTLRPGEASVVIAAAAAHREAAYTASRDYLERLKREVPIWKQEHYADGTARWREEEPLSPDAVATPSAASAGAPSARATRPPSA